MVTMLGTCRTVAFAMATMSAFVSPALAGDLGVVPLFNGERNDMLDLWGGIFSSSSGTSFAKQSTVVNSGNAAYQFNVGTIPSGGFQFFQAFSSAVDGTQDVNGNYIYRQDRDLTQYQSLQTYVRNSTGTPFTLTLELKDYRDSLSNRAQRNYLIPAGSSWTQIVAPLDLSSGWNVTGSPDLTRTFAVSYLVNATSGPVSGSVYFDDANLVENGSNLDVSTAPIQDVVERLAKRQFMGLWAARNKMTGIIPNSSDNVYRGALNTTTGVVWNLPSAVRHGWVTQADADAYMTQLIGSLAVNRDHTNYLPSRFLYLNNNLPFVETSNPSATGEESAIDAAFLALGLHNYMQQAATPATLRDNINTQLNRWDFSVFTGLGAFKQAYFPTQGNFGTGCSGGPCTYNGYTNENKVIALAASLSTAHNVPLATMWNQDTGRILTSLATSENYLNYSFGTDFRAAFEQALLNLFVDTSTRGADNYLNRALARNPWENFVRSEADIAARLTQLGRPNLLQPDAGEGPNATPPPTLTYHAWNIYNNFGQPNLFQPWSVAEALMAGAPGAEDALRFLLDNGLGTGLDGPQGLADWAAWPTGAANPTSVPSFADNWNITLSTMALLAYLDGTDRQNLFFANLPEVKAALDSVFVAGDYTGNGVVDAADYAYWRSTLGSINSLAADGNNDGVVNAADYVIWRKNAGGAGLGASSNVPEPGGVLSVLWVLGIYLLSASQSGRAWGPAWGLVTCQKTL